MRSLGAGLTVLLYFPNEKNTLFDAFWGRFPYLLLPSTTIIYVKVGKVDKGGHILSRFLSSSKNKALRLERPHWCNTRLPTLQRFNRAESWESAAICTAGVVAPVDALGPDWATSQSQDLWSDGIPQIPFTYMYIVYLYIYMYVLCSYPFIILISGTFPIWRINFVEATDRNPLHLHPTATPFSGIGKGDLRALGQVFQASGSPQNFKLVASKRCTSKSVLGNIYRSIL